MGEWLLFDTLHLTPAPYNAQTLLYLFVSVSFFVASLQVFSRWLPAGRWRWWFVCAALGLAVLHFTAVNHLHSYDPVLGPNAFFSLWSAHALVLPFLCLLVTGASVAAGGGQDLPLLALTDGYLLQMHVAQPLFVLPLTALALVALTGRSAAQEKDGIGFEPSPRRRMALWLSAGWRAHRGAHVLAAIILGFFAVPVLIDLNAGAQSNLAAILEHLRKHHDEHKTLIRSVYYFLQFGAYRPYQPDTIEFETFTTAGMMAYLRAHWFLFGLWTAAGPPGGVGAERRGPAARLRRGRSGRRPGVARHPARPAAVSGVGGGVPPGRGPFDPSVGGDPGREHVLLQCLVQFRHLLLRGVDRPGGGV